MMNYTTKDETTMPLVPYSIQYLNGKAAVFVRGLIDHMGDKPLADLPLRKSQAAGMTAVEELGETISVPYISKLTKLLETGDVITKVRKGKGYVINPSLNFYEVHAFMQDSNFGTTIEREASEEDIRLRSAFLDHMQGVGAIRIRSEEPLAKVAYMVAIEKFKAGKYDMVFIDRDIDLINDKDGFRVGYVYASVANQD